MLWFVADGGRFNLFIKMIDGILKIEFIKYSNTNKFYFKMHCITRLLII